MRRLVWDFFYKNDNPNRTNSRSALAISKWCLHRASKNPRLSSKHSLQRHLLHRKMSFSIACGGRSSVCCQSLELLRGSVSKMVDIRKCVIHFTSHWYVLEF